MDRFCEKAYHRSEPENSKMGASTFHGNIMLDEIRQTTVEATIAHLII